MAPSYAAAVSGGSTSGARGSSCRSCFFPQEFHAAHEAGGGYNFIKLLGRKNGKPALFLTDEETSLLASACRYTLVGKFPYGNPKLEIVRKHFDSLKLTGSWKVGSLDGRHVLIQLSNDADYTQLFAQKSLIVNNRFMKILKWTVDFDPKLESPIIPVWVNFPGLKAHLFNYETLYTLATAFGKPLKVDTPTLDTTRPSVACVLVECDITQPFPGEIWIGTSHQGYWQKIVMGPHPQYCSHCGMFGHSSASCYRLHPHLRSAVAPPPVSQHISAEVIPSSSVPVIPTALPMADKGQNDLSTHIVSENVDKDSVLEESQVVAPERQDTVTAPPSTGVDLLSSQALPTVDSTQTPLSEVIEDRNEVNIHSQMSEKHTVDQDQLSQSSEEE